MNLKVVCQETRHLNILINQEHWCTHSVYFARLTEIWSSDSGAFPLKFYKDPNYKRDFTSVCMLLTLQAVRLICFPTQLFTSTIRALISFSFFFMHDASNRWRWLILDQSASSSSFARIRLQDVGQKGIFRCDLSEKRQIFTEKIRR